MAEINKEDIFGGDLSAPLQELQGTLEDVLGTLDNLRQSGKNMERSFKDTATVTKQTNTETEKLANSIVLLEKSEKKLDDTVKKQTATQKNSGEAFKNSTEALDKMAPAQAQAIKGFQGMIQAAKAFIATPIGAVIAALAIVIGVVVKAFQKFEPVLDFFEDLITKASGAVNAFLDNIKLVGDIVGSVLSGQFAKAWQSTKQLAGSMGDAADEAQRLLDLTRDLEDAEMLYRIESASAANQIKAWVTAAKNKNLSIEESAELLKKASDLENEMTAKSVKNAQLRYEIERGLLIESKRSQLVEKGLHEQRMMSNEEYAAALIKSGIFSPEQLKPLIDAYVTIEQEASAGLALQEKIANNQAMLDEKREAARAKRMEQEAKEQALLLQRETVEKRLAGYKEKEIEIAPAVIKSKMDVHAADVKVSEEQANQAAVNAVLQQQRIDGVMELQNISNAFGAFANSMKKGTIAQKVFGSAQALINTYLAATQTLADPTLPFIAKIFAVAATISNGLRSVAQINNVKAFFKGTASSPEGLAFVGERGSELMNVPGEGLMLSPSTATLAHLKKGTEIIPHEKSMSMLAGSGVDVGKSNGFMMLNHLQLVNDSVKQIGNQIVGAVDRSSSRLITQGTEIYELKRMSDTKRKLIRSKSFSS